jgi:carboxylesterase
VPLMPGAEPYSHDGAEVGVLLCHGFTGTPQSMRPWGEYLAARGLTVSVPLLPGHGTRWQDMQQTGWQDWYAEVDRALRELTARC